MKIGSAVGCHQKHDRSFFYKDYQFPVCARCTGLFLGYITGILISIVLFFIDKNFFKTNIYYHLIIALLFVIILAIDGFGQLKGKWESTNKRRLITGLTSGIGIITIIIRLIFGLIRVIRC